LILADLSAPFDPGTVWLVGAGPGDPGLLTLHALHALRQAEVIVYDALVDSRILALAPDSAILEYAGKRGGKHSAMQQDICIRLVTLAKAGKRVLRLKGGDPFVFGRGGEEILALAAASVPFRIVPGLSSGLAALGLHTIPATMRGTNQAVILATGHSAEDEGPNWKALARTKAPIILYMAVANLHAIVDGLKSGGLPGETPAVSVHAATTTSERVIDTTLDGLCDLATDGVITAPAIIAIGVIASFRFRLMPELVRGSSA
jgi:uroporphyrin-III C-methyltransferase